jgi:hypothetical protein
MNVMAQLRPSTRNILLFAMVGTTLGAIAAAVLVAVSIASNTSWGATVALGVTAVAAGSLGRVLYRLWRVSSRDRRTPT